MAVTSLWHIRGRLKDLIDYVENPEKTIPKGTEDFFNVFSYVKNPVKTQNGEYVTAVNCLKETALQQMMLTKKRYGKEDNYIAWHGYQSFKIGEVNPQTAHEIGIKLAKEMWGDRFQIVVTTHLDKDHIHNHFCFNSVSFLDSKKYNYSKSEQQRLRDTSDRLCMEYGLSVIKSPQESPSRPVWLDEKAGKPTRYNIYRADVRDAINYSRSPKFMEHYLNRKGYITDFTGVHWKIKLPQYEHFTRLDTLDKSWTSEKIQRAMGCGTRYHSLPATVHFAPFIPADIEKIYTPFKRTSYIYRLYLYYCYELGYLPKGTQYKPTSPYLKEDLRKLDELTAQVDYMYHNKINTIDDLYADREKLESSMADLTVYRTKLQNKIRRATPEEKEILRQDKAAVTAQITGLRAKLKCNYAIEQRSEKIQNTLDLLVANEQRSRQPQQQPTKRRKDYERWYITMRMVMKLL